MSGPTKCHRVDFALDLNGGVLAPEDVDGLTELTVLDGETSLILLVFLDETRS